MESRRAALIAWVEDLLPGKRGALGFLASGTLSFIADMALLVVFLYIIGMNPFSARLMALAGTIVVSWLSHRNLTFAVTGGPRVVEFLRFAALASGVMALNFVVYALLLWFHLVNWPIAAMCLAGAISTTVSYLGMRLGVFRRRARKW